mgnify:FL=1
MLLVKDFKREGKRVEMFFDKYHVGIRIFYVTFAFSLELKYTEWTRLTSSLVGNSNARGICKIWAVCLPICKKSGKYISGHTK